MELKGHWRLKGLDWMLGIFVRWNNLYCKNRLKFFTVYQNTFCSFRFRFFFSLCLQNETRQKSLGNIIYRMYLLIGLVAPSFIVELFVSFVVQLESRHRSKKKQLIIFVYELFYIKIIGYWTFKRLLACLLLKISFCYVCPFLLLLNWNRKRWRNNFFIYEISYIFLTDITVGIIPYKDVVCWPILSPFII